MWNLVERTLDWILGYDPPPSEPHYPPEPAVEYTQEDWAIIQAAQDSLKADIVEYNRSMSNMPYYQSTAVPDWTRSVMLPGNRYAMIAGDPFTTGDPNERSDP